MTGPRTYTHEDAHRALNELEERLRLITDDIPHGGDCGGTLCPACGCCCHSTRECDCTFESCGCADQEYPTVLPDVNQAGLAAVAALRELVNTHQQVATSDTVHDGLLTAYQHTLPTIIRTITTFKETS